MFFHKKMIELVVSPMWRLVT